MVYQISRELAKRGHEVTIYASDAKRGNLRERVSKTTVKIDGINIIHFQNISPRLSEKIGIFLTPTMRAEFERQGKNFDLVHVHEVRSYQHVIIWQYAKKLELPYIIQAHGILGDHGGLSRKIYDFVCGRRILIDAKLNIALNDIEVEQYRRMGVPKSKIQIVPNGINLLDYAHLPAEGCFKKKFGLPKSDKIVLYLGRIHKIKGLDVLVRAFANVATKLDGVRLVIVGSDDGYLSELKAWIKALKIENKVLLLGPLFGLAKLELYADADIFVLPSRYEAFPISILEAYASGKLVIASSCKGLSKLVLNNDTGILVEAGNISELSTAMIFALSQNIAKWSCRSKEFVKQFSIEKTVDKIERLYSGVMSLK